MDNSVTLYVAYSPGRNAYGLLTRTCEAGIAVHIEHATMFAHPRRSEDGAEIGPDWIASALNRKAVRRLSGPADWTVRKLTVILET